MSPLPTDAKHALFLVDVGVVEAGEFADAKARGVEQFEQSAIAAEEEGFRLGVWRAYCAGSDLHFVARDFLESFATAA